MIPSPVISVLGYDPMNCFICNESYLRLQMALNNEKAHGVSITEEVPVWIPPNERFIEYGPEDEWYLRWAGLGHESTDTRKTVLHNVTFDDMKIDGNNITMTAVARPVQ